MTPKNLVLALACFSTVTFGLLDTDLIVAFSQLKHAQMGTVIICKSRGAYINFFRTLNENGLRFLLFDPRTEKKVGDALRRKYNHLAVVLDANCINHLAKINLDKQYFYETFHWLILSAPDEKQTSLDFLQTAPLNINSDVTLAVKYSFWEIYDAYNPASSHNGTLIAKKIGYYHKKNWNIEILANSKYWTRKNMTGVHFKTAVVIPDETMPLDYFLTSQKNRQLYSMHRFQAVTVSYCRDIYNFSLTMTRTNSWGYLTSNGHFDGLVGLLERRMVDFGSSPLIYKLDRMPVVDYSFGNWILKSSFIYKRPKIIEASYRIFMRPLSKTVWLCIAAMMLLLMLFLKWVFSRELRLLGTGRYYEVDASWSFLFLFTLGAFCQQGATCYPQLLSSRTLAVFVFLFCILIYQFYSASIVSYLLMDPPRKINNLRDLTDSNLRAGIEDILIDRNYFVQTTDPVAIELFNKKIRGADNDTGFYQPAEGLELVRQGGFAFHVETSTAYPIIEETFTNQEICELEEVQMYRTQPMHTNLQKDSPFRELLNYCMLHLVENGLMFRLRKYWDARTPICIQSAKKISIHVGLKEFSSGLIVLSYGVCLSLAILAGEVLVHNWKKIFRVLYGDRKVVKPYVN